MVLLRIILVVVSIVIGSSQIHAQQCETANAVGAPVASSSAGGNIPANVIDTLMPTVWQPIYGNGNYIYLDLGSAKSVCEVILRWSYTQFPDSFRIQATDNPISGTWDDLHTTLSNNPTLETSANYSDWAHVNTVSIPNNANSTKRYVRVWVGYIQYASWRLSKFEVHTLSGSTNSAPGCGFLLPTKDTTVAANSLLLLRASAQDNDGTIADVGFYSGLVNNTASITNLLNDPPQTQAPYEYVWTPTVPGTYYIQARAKDNVGAIGNSGIIKVTVTSPNTGWGLLGNSVAQPNTSTTPAFLGTTDPQPFIVKTNDTERYRVTATGQMLIGSTQLAPGAPANTLLTVNGYIMSKGLKITQLAVNWPDYVFEKSYKLMPLPTLEEFIKKNKHLPGVPSTVEVDTNGLSVGENQAILLKKIEELTLYLIEQDKKMKEQKVLIEKLSKEVEKCLNK